jgi:hypothetical protein
MYDDLGRRLTKVTRVGMASEETASWVFDESRVGFHNTGHVTSLHDSWGHISYNYDDGGRLAQGTRQLPSGISYTFQKGYDAGGRVLWTTYPDGDAIGTSGAPLVYDVNHPGIAGDSMV